MTWWLAAGFALVAAPLLALGVTAALVVADPWAPRPTIVVTRWDGTRTDCPHGFHFAAPHHGHEILCAYERKDGGVRYRGFALADVWTVEVRP